MPTWAVDEGPRGWGGGDAERVTYSLKYQYPCVLFDEEHLYLRVVFQDVRFETAGHWAAGHHHGYVHVHRAAACQMGQTDHFDLIRNKAPRRLFMG